MHKDRKLHGNKSDNDERKTSGYKQIKMAADKSIETAVALAHFIEIKRKMKRKKKQPKKINKQIYLTDFCHFCDNGNFLFIHFILLHRMAISHSATPTKWNVWILSLQSLFGVACVRIMLYCVLACRIDTCDDLPIFDIKASKQWTAICGIYGSLMW